MPSRRVLLLALLVAALAGLRLVGTPGLLGYGGAEVYGHAWVQGWHAAALPAWPAGTDLAEGTAIWPVSDPKYTGEPSKMMSARSVRSMSSLAASSSPWHLPSLVWTQFMHAPHGAMPMLCRCTSSIFMPAPARRSQTR